MDAEDERCFEAEMAIKRNDDVAVSPSPDLMFIIDVFDVYDSGMALRLYEEEERKERRKWKRYIMSTSRREQGLTGYPWGHFIDIGARFRLLRFFHSIQGFHEGSLDLFGRHEQRYLSLLERFERFTLDYQATLESARMEDLKLLETIGDTGSSAQSFMSNWHLSWNFDSISDVPNLYRDLIACRVKHPNPTFQTLLLQNLPPELIHIIMGHANLVSARALGATSRVLREISRSYIYKEYTLSSKPFIWKESADMDPDAAAIAYLGDWLRSSRERMLENVDYLLSRPDILQGIQTLTINSFWSDENLEMAGFDTIGSRDNFRLPVSHAMANVIRKSSNIGTLHLSGVVITKPLAEVIVSLPKLHTIRQSDCIVEQEQANLFICESLLNMTFISLAPVDLASSWNLLPSFPHLRYLVVYRGTEGSRTIPPLDLTDGINPFGTVERLHLINLSRFEIENMTTWMSRARLPTGPGLRLTHFKIEMDFGLDRNMIFDLLDALRGVPMQYFVLDGILYAEPELLDRIAEAFPDLISLTLGYRDSIRQTLTKPTDWPHATWEYARRLATFQHLRYFGWNLRISHFYPTPSVMVNFEDGFDERWFDNPEWDMQEDWVEDWECIARLFITCCPTLQSIVLTHSFVAFDIQRGPEGGPDIHSTIDLKWFPKMSEIEHMNDPDRFLSWPKF